MKTATLIYTVLIEKDDADATIYKIWSKDFKKSLPSFPIVSSQGMLDRLFQHIKHHLVLEIARCKNENIVIPPSSTPSVNTFGYSADRFYLSVAIELNNIKKGFFYKNLPRIGSVSNLIVTAVTTFVAFLSLQISFKGKLEGENNDIIQQSIAYSGASVQFLVLMILYIFSDASKILESAGRRIDAFIGGDKHIPDRTSSELSIFKRAVYVFCAITLPLLVLVHVFVTAISFSQQIASVIEKAGEEDILHVPNIATKIISIGSASLSVIPSLAYIQSFADKLIQLIKVKLIQAEDNQVRVSIVPVRVVVDEHTHLISEEEAHTQAPLPESHDVDIASLSSTANTSLRIPTTDSLVSIQYDNLTPTTSQSSIHPVN